MSGSWYGSDSKAWFFVSLTLAKLQEAVQIEAVDGDDCAIDIAVPDRMQTR